MNRYYERWYSEHWYFDSDPFYLQFYENGGEKPKRSFAKVKKHVRL